MVRLIVGNKGKGKTTEILAKANDRTTPSRKQPEALFILIRAVSICMTFTETFV